MVLESSALVAACQGREVSHTPVWFMRQAGRALPEYRALRADNKMLEACQTPELIAEITMQPVTRYGVDAAIFFSDIVVPLVAAGVEIDIVAGVGPVFEKPFATWSDLERIPELEAGQLDFITEAVRLLTAELGATPLIGFAGAPFTLASYLVEGGPSKNHVKTKTMMHAEPDLWSALMERLASISSAFLQAQVAAGASAIQLFDSWAGALPLKDYVQHVAPHSRRVLASVAGTGVPRIHFGVGTSELLHEMGQVGADVVGVDWKVDLADALRRIGPAKAVQGNLDPALVFAPWEVIAQEIRSILSAASAAPGHVFNLGHGVLPETDPDVLKRIVDEVHTLSAR